MTPKHIFDSINLPSGILLRLQGETRIYQLNALGSDAINKTKRLLLRWVGLKVEEIDFFVGNLRTPAGKSLWCECATLASHATLSFANQAIQENRTLSGISHWIGRDVFALYLARRIFSRVERQVMQIKVAELCSSSTELVVLHLRRQGHYDPVALATEIDSKIEVRCYGIFHHLSLLGEILYKAVATGAPSLAIAGMTQRVLRDATNSPASPGEPGILISLDGEYSLDRSCRSIGFFVDYERKLKPANYYVLGNGSRNNNDGANKDISKVGYFDQEHLGKSLRGDRLSSQGKHLLQEGTLLIFRSLGCWKSDEMAFLGEAGRLLLRSALFCELIEKHNIHCYLTGDTYSLDSDAMLVASRTQKIAAVAYQYSNLAFGNVIAVSVCDVMLMFSPEYNKLWKYRGIKPRRFVSTGYPYDESFSMVESRAKEHRAKLVAAGARFVVCYFDENVWADKYGFTHLNAHVEDLRLLAKSVLEDPTLGVIFKTQFRKRSPVSMMCDDPLFREAIGTGRIIDLQSGFHRNTVLPAEAAKASDIAIANLVGATAALEAALCGTRCVLINPGDVETENDAAYAKNPNLVFPSLGYALDHITKYRKGDCEKTLLGDWSKVFECLSLTSDGRAAERIRNLVVSLAYGERTAEISSSSASI